MNVGILQGSHPERVHLAGTEAPRCGARSRTNWGDPASTEAFWREWSGTLREVDCRRCLVMERARLKREAALVERRLRGEGGIQRDAFEGKT